MALRNHLPAILRALRYHDRSLLELEAIPLRDWPSVLHALDRAHLTLALGSRCRNSLPETVRQRIDANLQANRTRYERLIAAQTQIADALAVYGIDHVVLKGLAQWPRYTDAPCDRPQYDIDIFVPNQSMKAAVRTVQALGYEFAGEVLDPGTDHLPVMIRRTGWIWRDDYYDPEMPVSLELHFRFWNSSMMRFCDEDFSAFWQRRILRDVNGLRFHTLCPVDGLTYSAMHLVRHLLNGDMRLGHVYEIANFLERSAFDDAFWTDWQRTSFAPCRTMEAIAFRMARDWFHCNVHPAACDAIAQLPGSIHRWFSLFSSSPAWSPSTASDGSAKNEIWLHFCLLNTAKDKRKIAMRRLFPRRRMRVHLNPHIRVTEVSVLLRLRRKLFEVSFIAKRFFHHLRVLAPTLHGAYLWCFVQIAPADRKPYSETARS